MAIELISTVIPKNDGDFPIAYDVHVAKGNPALLASLAALVDSLTLHVSTSGVDLTGDGLTAGTAFRQIQRALDEIPDGAIGTVVIQCHGAGPFNDFVARNYRSQDALKIQVWADRGSPAWTRTAAAGTTVANPDGGDKAAVLVHNVGAYGTTFTNGSHWIEIVNDPYYLAVLMDGGNCATPNVRVVSGEITDLSAFGNFAAHAFSATLIAENGLSTDPNRATLVMNYGGPGQSVSVIGFRLPNFTTAHGVSLVACLAEFGGETAGSLKIRTHVHCQLEWIVNTLGRNPYYGRSYLSGIFEGGVIDIFSTCGLGPAILRYEDGNNRMIYIGTHSGGGPGPGADVDVYDVDAESLDGGGIPFFLAGGQMRINNFGKCSLQDCGRLVQAERHSYVNVNGNVYGTTSSEPIYLRSGSQAIVSGLGTGGGLTENATTPGANIKLGTKVIDFTGLPNNDIDQGAACEFTRASVS